MSVEVTIDDRASGKVAAVLEACGDAGRAHLHTTAANAVANQIQRHISLYARNKHTTATNLGGTKTHHYENGSADITSRGDANCGTVSIPIPGIQRAWHDIILTTPTKNGKNFLTIAKYGSVYGHTVSEARAMGWKIFRPGRRKDGTYSKKAPKILLGYRNKGDDKELLYTLAEKVRQTKDPSLLPSKENMAKTAADAVVKEIFRIIRKARGAA